MKKDNHYFGWGLTAVVSVCSILLFYDLVFRSSILLRYLGVLAGILAPVLYGAAMAYLLAPVVNWFEGSVFRRRDGRAGWIRAASIALTWLVVAVFLYAIISILLPELYKSVMQLVGNTKTYYNTVYNWVLHLLESNPEFASRAAELINEYYTDALTWLNENLVPQLQTAVSAVTGGVVGVLVFLKNLLIGVVVSVYLLGSKETFAAGGCKLCYTLLPQRRAGLVIRGVKAADRIFSGFVSSLFQFPYAPLVSVVVGVTNIIPFFGPFLGAIPSAFLILLDSPIKSLYFIIFILALQQFDGNILGPKILGDSTGISGFWVMVAILVAGCGAWPVCSWACPSSPAPTRGCAPAPPTACGKRASPPTRRAICPMGRCGGRRNRRRTRRNRSNKSREQPGAAPFLPGCGRRRGVSAQPSASR